MDSENHSSKENLPLSQQKVEILNPNYEEPTISAIQTAARQILNLPPSIPIHRFSEGTDHAVYALGNDYIARCLPRSERAIRNLRRDATVQSLAKRYVQKPGIVAEVMDREFVVGEWVGNIERRIEGVSLQKCQATEKTEDDLADLLRDLKNVPIEEAMAATGYQQERVNLKARVGKAMRAWGEMVEKGYAIDPEKKMETTLQEKLRNLSDEPYVPAFLHADINTENLLLDPVDGSIAGVIDWSDAMIGDPCIDLSGVIFAVGVAAARRVAAKACISELAVERAWLYTMTVIVRDLRDVLCGEGDEWGRDQGHLMGLLREEFERCFEGCGGVGGCLVREGRELVKGME